jgi:hypothetical protein
MVCNLASETTNGIVIGVLSTVIAGFIGFLGTSIWNYVTQQPSLNARLAMTSLHLPLDVAGKEGAGTWETYFASKRNALDCRPGTDKRSDLSERIKADLCKISFLVDWGDYRVFELRLKNTSKSVIKDVRLKAPNILAVTAHGSRRKFLDVPKEEPIEIGNIQPGAEMVINAISLGSSTDRLRLDALLPFFLLTADGTKVDIQIASQADESPDAEIWGVVTEYRIIFYVLALFGCFAIAGAVISTNDRLRRRMIGKADFQRMKKDIEVLGPKFEDPPFPQSS